MHTLTSPAPARRLDLGRALRISLRTFARVALGLIFVVCGLDGFLGFLPHPTAQMSEQALAFAGGLMKSGYFFPLLKGTEVIAGLLLLSNRFVPLALVVLAPVVVNIVAFHAFLAPKGVGLAAMLVGLELSLAWHHRSAYRSVMVARSIAA